ncbi:MAG: hypothetical protein EH225_10140, partial [Calditrichaeota bacterium]
MPNMDHIAPPVAKAASFQSEKPAAGNKTVDISQVVGGGKKVLEELRNKVPPTLFSLDKEQYIGNEIIEKLSNEERMVLRNLINAFLQEVRRKGASDIDMGG